MAKIGYARVSSLDQDLEGQFEKLRVEGCSIIRSEKVSGASREGRPELATVLQFLRSGDELVVTRLDRLGRDTRDVLNLIHECEQRGASVTVLDPMVSTRGEMGYVVITVLGMVAQMERRFIKERQREGIERAALLWHASNSPSVCCSTRRVDMSAAGVALIEKLCLRGARPVRASAQLPARLGAVGCKSIGLCKARPKSALRRMSVNSDRSTADFFEARS